MPPLVSGPQGPRVVLDGKPVLLLCSNNYLGFADHPRVREAAADAAMRWAVGAGASRVVSGTMTIHRRLEEALCEFERPAAAVLFGPGPRPTAGVAQPLGARGGPFSRDEPTPPSIAGGCRLSGAPVAAYRHCDPEHLAWTIARADVRRGGTIVTDA